MIEDDLGPKLSTEEAARFLGISSATLYRLKDEGKGPSYVKVGGQFLWPAKWLKSYLLRNTVCHDDDCDKQGRGD
jgi:excisionase family DNA binding protein